MFFDQPIEATIPVMLLSASANPNIFQSRNGVTFSNTKSHTGLETQTGFRQSSWCRGYLTAVLWLAVQVVQFACFFYLQVTPTITITRFTTITITNNWHHYNNYYSHNLWNSQTLSKVTVSDISLVKYVCFVICRK